MPIARTARAAEPTPAPITISALQTNRFTGVPLLYALFRVANQRSSSRDPARSEPPHHVVQLAGLRDFRQRRLPTIYLLALRMRDANSSTYSCTPFITLSPCAAAPLPASPPLCSSWA